VGILQPTFSPDGRFLAYISNQSGWENLYLYDCQEHTHRALTREPVECGQPAWLQGMRTYGFRHDGQGLYYLPNDRGFRRLWYYDLQRGCASEQQMAWQSIRISTSRPCRRRVPPSPALPQPRRCHRVLTVPPLENQERPRVCRRSASENVPRAELSTPQALTWATAGGNMVHGLFYAPSSSRFQGSGQPPAIIYIHGGPTSQAVASFHPQTQFFTTRGYAVLQVNHRGSTGYGKAYVEALRGQWGVYDVEDAVSGAVSHRSGFRCSPPSGDHGWAVRAAIRSCKPWCTMPGFF
jgi:hypothetical protein